MTSWLASLIVAVIVLYPAVVYFGRNTVPPLALVAAVLALVGLRLAVSNSTKDGLWRYPLIFAAAGVFALVFVDVELAERGYPALMALGVAALFGYTLFRPPTLVERIARPREPDLSADGIAYCRKVTLIWTLFSLCNAAIAAGTALWGSLELWSLWTGLISYMAMGVLFVGEIAVRGRLRRNRA
jgi:uncharacterized membrane protein